MRVTPVLLAAFLFVGALLPGCFWRKPADPRSTPEGVVEAFLTAFQGKDLDTMIGLHLDQNICPEDRDFLGRLTGLVEIRGFAISGVEQVSPDEALVQVEITLAIFGRERTQSTTYRVFRKDGQWALCGEPALP